MEFRMEYFTQHLGIHVDASNSVDFDYGGPHSMRVSFRKASHDELMRGKGGVVCTAVCSREPKPAITAMFQSLGDGRPPEGSAKPEPSVFGESASYLDSEGRIKLGDRVPFGDLPGSLQAFLDNVHAELGQFANQTISVLRWRMGLEGVHNPLSINDVSWSFDGVIWHPHTVRTNLSASISVLPRVNREIQAEVLNFVTTGQSEPLGHELLREARAQSSSNSRSALLIGIAAVEVGFKQAAAKLVPSTEWLMENVPSPPLEKMLTEYLPTLPAKLTLDGKVLPPPSRLQGVLKKGVLLRNKATHVGLPSLRHESLDEILDAAQDVLWLLDYYCGEAWALEHVSEMTRNELKL